MKIIYNFFSFTFLGLVLTTASAQIQTRLSEQELVGDLGFLALLNVENLSRFPELIFLSCYGRILWMLV